MRRVSMQKCEEISSHFFFQVMNLEPCYENWTLNGDCNKKLILQNGKKIKIKKYQGMHKLMEKQESE